MSKKFDLCHQLATLVATAALTVAIVGMTGQRNLAAASDPPAKKLAPPSAEEQTRLMREFYEVYKLVLCQSQKLGLA